MLLSTLMVVGILPGIPIYVLSEQPSIMVFFLLYVVVVFLFSIISVPKINCFNTINKYQFENKINFKLLNFFVTIGVVFFIYLLVKYHSIVNLRSFTDVYVQRAIFGGLVSTWEVYLIIFSKYISSFSSLIVAVIFRKPRYLLPVFFILFTDYLLAAHKMSLLLILFSILYYYKLSRVDLKKKYFPFLFISISIFSVFMNLSIHFKWKITPILISLYDRSFHVTTGLFSRFYDFTQENYFFHGGSGLIGKIFGGVDNGEFYTFVIGEEYFSEGVRANADIIADGYINFGVIGSVLALLFLRLFFNNKDDTIFSNNYGLLMPLVFIYSIVLFSMGLQTSLLTGGMFFFILLIKFGFK